jgi:hypothetical protein
MIVRPLKFFKIFITHIPFIIFKVDNVLRWSLAMLIIQYPLHTYTFFDYNTVCWLIIFTYNALQIARTVTEPAFNGVIHVSMSHVCGKLNLQYFVSRLCVKSRPVCQFSTKLQKSKSIVAVTYMSPVGGKASPRAEKPPIPPPPPSLATQGAWP